MEPPSVPTRAEMLARTCPARISGVHVAGMPTPDGYRMVFSAEEALRPLRERVMSLKLAYEREYGTGIQVAYDETPVGAELHLRTANPVNAAVLSKKLREDVMAMQSGNCPQRLAMADTWD